MAINLKDHSRLPAVKVGRYRNDFIIQTYKRQFNYCEYCALDGYDITTGLELHHIIGGVGRNDKLWNIIHLCRPCHELATTHKNGVVAVSYNLSFFALKYLKGEISDKTLDEIQLKDEVLHLKKGLEPAWKKWIKGLTENED
jgi:hypothetical protein